MITPVIQDVLAEMDGDPFNINDGRCEEFMQRVVRRVPGAEERCSAMMVQDGMHPVFGGHVWVYFDGRHYDAETPDGVRDWRALPFMDRKIQTHLATTKPL